MKKLFDVLTIALVVACVSVGAGCGPKKSAPPAGGGTPDAGGAPDAGGGASQWPPSLVVAPERATRGPRSAGAGGPAGRGR